MRNIFVKMQAALHDRRGVTALEYGVIAALILVVIIAGVTVAGEQLQITFNKIGSSLTTANSGR